MASGISYLVNGAIAGINALIRVYNAIPFLPNVSTIQQVSAPSITIPKVSTSSVSGSTSTSGISIPSVPTVSTTSVSSSTTKTSSTNISGTGITTSSGVNTNTLAGIAAASGGGITVNVNGAIDPEGTARTIVNTLNSSFYRGTGGAGGLVTA